MLSPSYWVGQKVWSGFPKQKNPNKLFSQSNISLGALGLWNPWQKGADRSWLQGFLLDAQWRGAVTVAYLAIRLADLAEIRGLPELSVIEQVEFSVVFQVLRNS